MIYFIRSAGTDFVKIGYTRDYESLDARLRTLQTGHPYKLEIMRVLEAGDQEMENLLHEFFAEHRTHGEWFRYRPEMMITFFESRKVIIRRYLEGKTRRELEDMIEALINLLDEWTPDSDLEAEPDEPDTDADREAEPDDEPEDAEMSFVAVDR